MPSQIRWDEHVMNPPLSFSLESERGARQLHFIKKGGEKKERFRNQLGNEWECMFHVFSLFTFPQAKDL